MANTNSNEEPSNAPGPNRWYDFTLGPSFKDDYTYSPKFCTLRYEFKPASIDNTQPGTLHKSKDNRIKLEFQNNQHGKSKVSFDGVIEDYRDNDAVLFFDGETFRLEKLHRAVKRLRYLRMPGESAAAAVAPASATSVGSAAESYLSPASKGTQVQGLNTVAVQSVKVEQIDLNSSESLDSAEHGIEKQEEHPSCIVNLSTTSQNPNAYESEEDVSVDDDDNDDDGNGRRTAKMENPGGKEFRTGGLDIDINLPHPVDSEDEIADVDVNDDEADKGLNAAEVLRAQVNAESREGQQSSTSSSGSESESSESGSGSGESGSESSESGSGSSESESGTESCASH